MLDPVPTESEIASHYRSKFDRGNYELARRFADEYRPVHERIAAWVTVEPGQRVLDVGCFTGDLLAILADQGADVYGVELQSEAVAIANEKLGSARVFEAELTAAEFPPGPYDVITLIAAIEHVLDPRLTVRRAHELLKPRGRLYLETPNSDSVLARLMQGLWPPLAPVEHIHLFGARALRMLLEQEGFQDIRTKPHVKRLPFAYVYEQFANFGGRRWQRAAAPVRRIVGRRRLPFYIGEMLVSARRDE